MVELNKITIGFTKKAALFFICHLEDHGIFDSDETANAIVTSVKAKGKFDQKLFCKEILSNVDNILIKGATLGQRINDFFYDITSDISISVIVEDTIEELTIQGISESPHIIIACPPFENSSIKPLRINRHHNFVFLTPLLKNKYWLDSCEIKPINNKVLELSPTRKEKFKNCDLHNHCDERDSIIESIINPGYKLIGEHYPIIGLVRPSEAVSIIRYFQLNYIHIRERAIPEVKSILVARENERDLDFNT